MQKIFDVRDIGIFVSYKIFCKMSFERNFVDEMDSSDESIADDQSYEGYESSEDSENQMSFEGRKTRCLKGSYACDLDWDPECSDLMHAIAFFKTENFDDFLNSNTTKRYFPAIQAAINAAGAQYDKVKAQTNFRNLLRDESGGREYVSLSY